MDMDRIMKCRDTRSLVLTMLCAIPEYMESPLKTKNAIYDMVVRSIERSVSDDKS